MKSDRPTVNREIYGYPPSTVPRSDGSTVNRSTVRSPTVSHGHTVLRSTVQPSNRTVAHGQPRSHGFTVNRPTVQPYCRPRSHGCMVNRPTVRLPMVGHCHTVLRSTVQLHGCFPSEGSRVNRSTVLYISFISSLQFSFCTIVCNSLLSSTILYMYLHLCILYNPLHVSTILIIYIFYNYFNFSTIFDNYKSLHVSTILCMFLKHVSTILYAFLKLSTVSTILLCPYNSQNSSASLSNSSHFFTTLYMSLHLSASAFSCNSRQFLTCPTTLQPSTSLYNSFHVFTILYNSLRHFSTTLYNSLCFPTFLYISTSLHMSLQFSIFLF